MQFLPSYVLAASTLFVVMPHALMQHRPFKGCLALSPAPGQDYIWFSPACLRVLDTLAMPWEDVGLAVVPEHANQVPFPPIPNYLWPSDHLAVAATLQLLPLVGTAGGATGAGAKQAARAAAAAADSPGAAGAGASGGRDNLA